uniref:Lysosome-associated membrane glycoprotein 5 n=1 Tax=Ornithodoros turicata TaxID=34597 RepID=A0A2R5LDT1_9ACAR
MVWSYAAVLLFAFFAVLAGQELTNTTVLPSTLAPPTVKPTVSPNTTSTTTSAPTTTTTLAPSTTPAPTGPPKNTYNVTFANGTACILMEAAMQLKISYLSHNKTREAVVPLDKSASVNSALSTCQGQNNTQVLAISFAEHDSVTFVFKKNSTVFISEIGVNFTEDSKYFPESDQPDHHGVVNNGQLFLFSVLPGKSYLCNRDGPVTVSDGVTLDLLSVQLQAFRTNDTSDPGQFGAATECSSGDISNIIPIAVGVCLAALVLIVLIAYMIGRRRSRQKGYQSV